ncbi:hypothetical protein CEXT_184431 [Caerostris extrusa]|uniref:Uncharacterized protein n=1 Tax=Caerostris extrusa TaxID=172846 RepID=A0AAV4VQS0_CAEEX|nr:hypothetical protein CEXT_184431 [Caerostris extrusa]
MYRTPEKTSGDTGGTRQKTINASPVDAEMFKSPNSFQTNFFDLINTEICWTPEEIDLIYNDHGLDSQGKVTESREKLKIAIEIGTRQLRILQDKMSLINTENYEEIDNSRDLNSIDKMLEVVRSLNEKILQPKKTETETTFQTESASTSSQATKPDPTAHSSKSFIAATEDDVVPLELTSAKDSKKDESPKEAEIEVPFEEFCDEKKYHGDKGKGAMNQKYRYKKRSRPPVEGMDIDVGPPNVPASTISDICEETFDKRDSSAAVVPETVENKLMPDILSHLSPESSYKSPQPYSSDIRSEMVERRTSRFNELLQDSSSEIEQMESWRIMDTSQFSTHSRENLPGESTTASGSSMISPPKNGPSAKKHKSDKSEDIDN